MIQSVSVNVLLVGEGCLTVMHVFNGCVVSENAGVRIADFRLEVVNAVLRGAGADEVLNAMHGPASMAYEVGGPNTIYLYDTADAPKKALWIGDVVDFEAEEILFASGRYGAALS